MSAAPKFKDAFAAFYEGGKKPADAIRLAIADHRTLNGKTGGSLDFIDSLHEAERIVEAAEDLYLAASRLLEHCSKTTLGGPGDDFEYGYRSDSLGPFLAALKAALREAAL